MTETIECRVILAMLCAWRAGEEPTVSEVCRCVKGRGMTPSDADLYRALARKELYRSTDFLRRSMGGGRPYKRYRFTDWGLRVALVIEEVLMMPGHGREEAL